MYSGPYVEVTDGQLRRARLVLLRGLQQGNEPIRSNKGDAFSK